MSGQVAPARIARLRTRLSAARLGLSIVGLVALPYVLWANRNVASILGFDAYTTWSIDLQHLYEGIYLDLGAFRYSPVYAQVFAWVHVLPWEAFLAVWLGILVAILVRWCRSWTLAILAAAPVTLELYHGNIHVFMAAAMLVGVRYPVAWAFPLLAKVTPGLAVAWFAGRGEWRKLAVAIGFTGALCAVSFVLAPDLWRQFYDVNVSGAQWRPETPFPVDIPWHVRAAVALPVALVGGRKDWRWTIPVAGFLSLPIIWWHGFSMLVAVIPALRSDIQRGTVRVPRRLLPTLTALDPRLAIPAPSGPGAPSAAPAGASAAPAAG